MPVLPPWLKSARPPHSGPLRTHPVPDSAVTEADKDISGNTFVSSQCSDAGEAVGSAPELPIQERPRYPPGPSQTARHGGPCRAGDPPTAFQLHSGKPQAQPLLIQHLQLPRPPALWPRHPASPPQPPHPPSSAWKTYGFVQRPGVQRGNEPGPPPHPHCERTP